MKKRIIVNTRLLLPNKLEGIGRVADELLSRLTHKLQNVEFHFLFDRKFSKKFIYNNNVIPHILLPQARHPVLYYLFFEYSIPYMIKKIKPDLYLSPEPFLPLKSNIKKLVIFHDIAYEHFPQGINKIELWYYKHFFPRFAKNANKIIAVSNFTKQDLIKKYNIPENKITVAYNGISNHFKPISETEKEKIRKQFANGNPYFIYVGSIHPRKNVANLLKAFDLFKQTKKTKHKLLLTGRLGWKIKTTIETYKNMKYKNDVIFTGYVDDKTLSKLYAASECLCYVSIFEGFGLPIVEAMSTETAVICSNTSSMKEIGNNAAILVNPYNINEIAHAMIKITDPLIRNKLIQKSKQHIKKFSWENFTNTIGNEIYNLLYKKS